jgi:thymidylate kinase
MRVLVDGPDMSGKSTLVRAVVDALGKRGIPALPHKGMLTQSHPVVPLLRRLPLVRQPCSPLITAIFLIAGFALDAALFRMLRPRPDTHVLVQDAYVDRCVAFGIAGGPYRSARWALRHRSWFISFDLAVYLHAPAAVRASRLLARTEPDENDIRSVRDREFADTFTRTLITGMGPRHHRLLVVDTAAAMPLEMAEQVVDHLLGRGTGP